MKALITAGGRGTRLRPITHTLNKHLVPICNEPLIFRAIKDAAQGGIKDIIININAGDKELPGIVGDGQKWEVNIHYVEQHEPRGLAHVLLLAKDHLQNDSFLFYYGDNVLAGGLKPHIQSFQKSESDCHLCLSKVNHPERFGVAVVRDNKVTKTVEKPKEFISDLAITGIQFYNSNIFEAIKHIKPTPPKPPRTIAEMDIPPANQWLIDNGYSISYSIITDWWKDTGKPQDMIEANKLILKEQNKSIQGKIDSQSEITGTVVINKGTKIVNSTIIGPVVIGENCTIKNSHIGPNCSIARESHIKNSKIENSIILEKCILNSVPHMDNSIIGQSVIIEENQDKKQQFLIGDNGLVKL